MKNSDMESTKDVYKVTFVLCGAFFHFLYQCVLYLGLFGL